MTVNCNESPNHLRLTGDTRVGHSFGPLSAVTPIVLPGEGHRPHINLRFRGSVSIDLDKGTAAEIVRDLPAAIIALGVVHDVSTASTHLGGTA